MKTIAYLGMSLNGMIAKSDDSTPWSDTNWDNFNAAVNEFGNLILGYRTYKIMETDNDFAAFAKLPFTVVICAEAEVADTVVAAKTIHEALDLVKAKGFERALVGGGSRTVTSFIQERLLDELWLDVEPKLIGNGINLIKPMNLVKELQLIEVKQQDEDIVHLKYRVMYE